MSVTILGEEYPIATTTELYLHDKNLTSLPELIGMLFNLQILNLYNNKLTRLWVDKKPCFLSSPMVMNRKSETFSIHDTPNSIGSLSNLRELYLYNNKITSLPDSIGMLSNLQKLYLQNNNLTNLPESIGNLSNLQYLDLSYNKLTRLPKSIQSLSNLQELYLHDNNLTSISESIQTLTKIEDFVLDESSYEINNLSMDCHTLILTYIKNNITNLPASLRTLYLKSNINVDMIKLPYGCDIIRF